MDLVAHLYRQRAFSRATFGPGDRTLGVVEHIGKELEEIKKAKAAYDAADESDFVYLPNHAKNGFKTKSNLATDLKNEWVDVIILGFDGLWRTGATPEEIVELIKRKQEKNELRRWPDWRNASPDQAIEHVKE